jgi:beta-lactamase class D
MKRIAIFWILLVSLTMTSQTKNSQDKEILVSEFNKILDSLKVKGAVLIYDIENKTYYSNNFSWAKTGIIPASTFKIPNSIIALETGVIKNDSVIFKWNGEKRWNKKWEQDLTFKEAFQVSCVPCYQEVARKIGVKRMKDYLQKLNYRKMVFDSSTIDNFWLDGASKITQIQQIDFLKRFYFSELPISKRTESIVKNIILIEKTNAYTLSGKTGLSVKNDLYNGWFVGYFETKNKVYFFATNLEPIEKEAVNDDFYSARINATKQAFKNLNFL